MDIYKRKVKTLEELMNVNINKDGIVVFTNGCFDILHSGHVSYLEQAKRLGTILIVGMNSDESVRRLKGDKRPINSFEERAFVLSHLTSVNYIVKFDEDTPEELIKSIMPDILVKGGDYKVEEIVGYDFVKSYKGRVMTLPLIEGCSTTNIIEKIKRELDTNV